MGHPFRRVAENGGPSLQTEGHSRNVEGSDGLEKLRSGEEIEFI
jgi:hypothetical protein